MSGKKLKILAIEPYCGGSHRYFLQGLERHSRHRLTILSLPARYWKWRMHGGAVTLAEEALELDEEFDLIFATEMLNLPNFLALTRRRSTATGWRRERSRASSGTIAGSMTRTRRHSSAHWTG